MSGLPGLDGQEQVTGLPPSPLPGGGREETVAVDDLKKQDAYIRSHVEARMAMLGRSGGTWPRYEFTRGPDGKMYVTGGSVDIRMTEIPGDPQGTIDLARRVRRIASTPPQLSPEDRQAVVEAATAEWRARYDLERQKAATTALYTPAGRKAEPTGPGGLFTSLG